MKEVQSRKWLLTQNNPADKGWTHDKIKEVLSSFPSITYYCIGDEQGMQERTYHTHMFIAANSPIRFSTIKARFPEAHIDKAQGSAAENQAYVSKSGKWKENEKSETSIPNTYEEWGELPVERQGERTDLARLYEFIKEGLSNYEIMEQNPDYILSLDKVERARQAVREQQYRETFRELEIAYVWGRSGTGKTRSIMDQYGYSGVYRATDYIHPFDNYMGEDVLLLDEYHSSIKFQILLNILDGYPMVLPARYTNKVACYTKVYILSNICLSKQYTDVQFTSPETFNALLRCFR